VRKKDHTRVRRSSDVGETAGSRRGSGHAAARTRPRRSVTAGGSGRSAGRRIARSRRSPWGSARGFRAGLRDRGRARAGAPLPAPRDGGGPRAGSR